MSIDATLSLIEETDPVGSRLASKPSTTGLAIAALAHQIRNPLTVAGLQLEKLSVGASSEVQATVDKVHESLRRIEDCLQSSIAFVGGEISDKVDFTAIDLNDEFRRVCTYTLTESVLEWHCLIDETVVIHGSQKALVSALLNLVDNAEVACGTALKLCVVFSTQKDQLIIEVLDNGPGISADNLQKVKLPFVSQLPPGERKAPKRAARARSVLRKSQGLGLAIINSVVKAHKGEFVILSDAGMGVNAVVRLPLVK